MMKLKQILASLILITTVATADVFTFNEFKQEINGIAYQCYLAGFIANPTGICKKIKSIPTVNKGMTLAFDLSDKTIKKIHDKFETCANSHLDDKVRFWHESTGRYIELKALELPYKGQTKEYLIDECKQIITDELINITNSYKTKNKKTYKREKTVDQIIKEKTKEILNDKEQLDIMDDHSVRNLKNNPYNNLNHFVFIKELYKDKTVSNQYIEAVIYEDLTSVYEITASMFRLLDESWGQ